MDKFNPFPYKDRAEHEYANKMQAYMLRADYINKEGKRLGFELKKVSEDLAAITRMAVELTADIGVLFQEHLAVMESRRKEDEMRDVSEQKDSNE